MRIVGIAPTGIHADVDRSAYARTSTLSLLRETCYSQKQNGVRMFGGTMKL
nr:MAG TPA: hypothetical protein [Caudoviricetes sp.]